MSTPYAPLASWGEAAERRYAWFLEHVQTCQACDLCPEDGDGTACPDLERFWDEGGVHDTVPKAGRAGDGEGW